MNILMLTDGSAVRVTDNQLTELRSYYGDALRRMPRREIIRHIHTQHS